MIMAEFDLNSWEDELLDDTPAYEDVYENPKEGEEPHEEYDEPAEDEDLLSSFLKTKGINPDSVKFETENGYEEIPFSELSRDEQLLILGDFGEETNLSDEETNLVNQLRNNNWSVEDYNNYIAQAAIRNYTQNQLTPEQFYSVDDYSDEELFVADLQSKIKDITEDEALEELQNAKSNEVLFNKRVAALREEYKAREDEEREQRELAERQTQEEQMSQFRNTVLTTIEQNRDIDLGGIPMEMSDEDMNTVASFLLDSDAAGVRHIAKALNDPTSLFQIAWWLTKGQDAFREINNYYKQEITKVAKNNYNRGIEDAKSGKINSAKAVVKKPRKPSGSSRSSDPFDDLV